MTRFGYIMFNALFIGVIYTLMYRLGVKREALISTTTYFVAPYICTNMFMSIFALMRWFMKQNPDISREGITFLHASWLCTLFAFIGFRFVVSGGNISRMFTGLL